MSRPRKKTAATKVPVTLPVDIQSTLPRGRVPSIGMRELVAALHRRRDRRRATAAELGDALQRLSSSVEGHLARIGELRKAIEAQGGDLSHLQHYDNVMARLRAELRFAERALADAFGDAARS